MARRATTPSAPIPNQRKASPPAVTAQTASADKGKVTTGQSFNGPRGCFHQSVVFCQDMTAHELVLSA